MQQMQVAETPTDVDGTLSDLDIYIQNLRTAQPNPFMLDS
jgi:3-deoxy-D-manno-octulosonate 8-phosphate phosphatase KdsC-like HAD superfamily phosphatase